MSETSLPLPVDLPATSLSGPRPGSAALTEVPVNEELSDFSALLILEVEAGEAAPSKPPAELTEPLNPVKSAAYGKDLPPPPGMPMPPPMLEPTPRTVPASGPAAEVIMKDPAPASSPPLANVPMEQQRAEESPEPVPRVAHEFSRASADTQTPVSQRPPAMAAPLKVAGDTQGSGDSHLPDLTDVLSGRFVEQPAAPQVEQRAVVGPMAEAPRTGTAERPSFPLAEPVHTPQWNDGLSNRVTWMVNHDVQQAELRLNPPELGPLEVRIAVRNDETRIMFTAQHALVRDAVEAALPRLRELMAASGLNLAQVDVGQHSPGGDRQPGAGPDADLSSPAFAAGTLPDMEPAPGPVAGFGHQCLVDDYA